MEETNEKISILFVTLLAVLLLSGCGRSEAVLDIESRIDQISSITIDSGELLRSIENDYRNLSSDEQKKVRNYSEFESYQSEYRTALKEAKEQEEKQSFLDDAAAVAIQYGVDDLDLNYIDKYELSDSDSQRKYQYTFEFSSTAFESLSVAEKLHLVMDIRVAYLNGELKDQDKIKIGKICINDWKNGVVEDSKVSSIANSAWIGNGDIFHEEPLSSFYDVTSEKQDGKRTCPNCGGTGIIKYYYGSSAIEAALDGYDDYQVGECSMCKGTGEVD